MINLVSEKRRGASGAAKKVTTNLDEYLTACAARYYN